MTNTDKPRLLNVQMAAAFLGVNPATIRRWAKERKVVGVKVGTRGDWRFTSDALQRAVQTQTSPTAEPARAEHTVQFYESDEALIDRVSRFLGAGDAAVVVATPEHAAALTAKFSDTATNQLIVLDAGQTLELIMPDGRLNPACFKETMTAIIDQAGSGGRYVHVFGEMVAVLWSRGETTAAAQLEYLWNQLQRTRSFSLYCAYPLHAFHDESHGNPFAQVCAHHSSVRPAESFDPEVSADERLRAIAILQQRSQVLEAEIKKRQAAEQKLSERNLELEALNAELLSKQVALRSTESVVASLMRQAHTFRDAS